MSIAAKRTRRGEHFDVAHHQRMLDVLCGVGCAAFVLTASAGVVATTASILSSGTSSLSKVDRNMATVGVDTNGDAPLGGTDSKKSDTKDTSAQAHPSDADASDDKTSGQSDTASATDEAQQSAVTSEQTTSQDMSESDSAATAETESSAAAPAPEAPKADQTYIVQRGDTLCEISAQFGVSVDAIAARNQIRDVNVIYTGSALVIPAA